MEVFTTKRYDRALAKVIRRNTEYYIYILTRLKLLKDNPNHPSLRLHKLANREDEYTISIYQSIRVIFHREKDTCYLLDIGTHDEVY